MGGWDIGRRGSVAAPFPWHKIWQLKVTNKVQIFLWLFIHNSLPLRRTLKRRRIKTETLCPMCNKLDEDCGHLFFKCKGARECWRALHMEELRCTLANCGSGMEVEMKIWEQLSDTQLKIVVWLWNWWTARNKTNAGDECYLFGSHVVQPKWKPPHEDLYKLNVDAAFSASTKMGGWGYVARDNTGAVLDIGAGFIQRAASALHAEAMAAYQDLSRAAHIGMTRVQLEMDASNLGKGKSLGLGL
ncbi:hypothetical protein SORBI_3002G141050 [Sorghum bicolor]|uniref:Reverse transcriptase zinc-binding domain-containing protein n=1 Tax=Sorghum bicolor TaxID=4558 RepID=A0A1W0W3W7_SORBI|nr:hypothetical protein SORBI_3002G141050 [Sorghum bicolor]